MPDVASWIWSPLMIDGASRYAVLRSVEHVTNGSFGSSLPARMSSLVFLHMVAITCNAMNWKPGRVFCRQFFS